MGVERLRAAIQVFSFAVLTYGGRLGIHLGYALPCFSCPYVSGCGGYCFLMFLQRVGVLGIAAYDKLFTYIGLKNLLWFAVFIMLALLFSKFWCGWICPFGTLQDALSGLRRRLNVREAEFSGAVRNMISPIKYIFLTIIIVAPLLVGAKLLSGDFYILFCKICPARVIMPLFTGDLRRMMLDYSNMTTLILTVISVSGAAVTIVGSFFKDRFFCLVCPMLPLIQMVNKISPVQFVKKADGCSGCGNCRRVCPMDIRAVHEERNNRNVMTEDCILCGKCLRSCPEDNVLTFNVFSRKLFTSSRKSLLKKMLRKAGEKI